MWAFSLSVIFGLNVWGATGNPNWGWAAASAIWCLDAIAERTVKALREK